MKVIFLFNHKGGVSKTTTAFNMGWMLAEQGHKTLIVDADTQCNLTALVLDYNSVEDIEDYYARNPGCDLSTGLEPVMSGSNIGLQPGQPSPTSNQNLFIYCGNLALSEVETQISVALTTAQKLRVMINIPGSIGKLLRLTAEKLDFDYIIIDMSPSVGALNECLLMSSDYFIVPTCPDFFCAQAIKSLSKILPKWNQDVQPFRAENIDYPLPSNSPKFLGFISQRYRPRNGAPVKSFQKWIDTIKTTVNSQLIPELSPLDMTVKLQDFQACVSGNDPYNLVNVADFNSLIAQSQQHNVPVFALSDDQIEQAGVILNTMKKNRDDFHHVFSTLASEIHKLTERVK